MPLNGKLTRDLMRKHNNFIFCGIGGEFDSCYFYLLLYFLSNLNPKSNISRLYEWDKCTNMYKSVHIIHQVAKMWTSYKLPWDCVDSSQLTVFRSLRGGLSPSCFGFWILRVIVFADMTLLMYSVATSTGSVSAASVVLPNPERWSPMETRCKWSWCQTPTQLGVVSLLYTQRFGQMKEVTRLPTYYYPNIESGPSLFCKFSSMFCFASQVFWIL